jgi:hypothetical protein
MAIGQYLRITVKQDVRKPLMRGVILDLGDGDQERMKWRPLIYEHFPNFCYTCGIIAHTDRMCDIQLGGVQSRFWDSFLKKNSELNKLDEIRKIRKFQAGIHSKLNEI